MTSKSVERLKQSARMRQTTDNRLTDHVTEKCVGIGGIAGAAKKTILANNKHCRDSRISQTGA